MKAMEYEHLLRRVYNCERRGARGADADVYRRMERAEGHLKNPHWNKTQEQKEYDYQTAFFEVLGYVKKALNDGAEQISHKTTIEEKVTLEAMLQKLLSRNFFDKGKLDIIIEEASKLFRKYGLEMR